MKFTEKSVAALLAHPPAGERKIISDDIPSFGIRFRPGRAPNWDLQFSLAGKQERMSFGKVVPGTVAAISRQAAEAYAKAKLGQDPRGERQTAPASDSIGAVLKLYLPQKKASVSKRSYVEIERHLLRDAAPLHDLSLRSEPLAMTTALLPLFNGLGPAAHGNLRSALSAFFRWMLEQGLADRNPIIAIKPRPVLARERVLTLPELNAVLQASAGNDDFSHIIRLLLYTGCRANEIAGLRWSEICDDRIVLPAARVKNKRSHELPITSEMCAVLEHRGRQPGRDNVFGRFPGRPFTGWSKSKQLLDERMRKAGAVVAPWVVHDLRRSAATYMNELGTAPHIVEAALNHQSGHKRGVAGTYNQAQYKEPIEAALTQWNAFLTEVEKGRKSIDGKVVRLRKPA